MSYISLTRSPYRQEFASSNAQRFRRTRVTPTKWKMQFGPTTLIAALVVVGAVLSFLYLMHFNQVATKGYDLKRLDVDRQHLMEQNQLSNMNIDKVKSMQTILASGKVLRMVQASEVSFVRGDSAIASVDVR